VRPFGGECGKGNGSDSSTESRLTGQRVDTFNARHDGSYSGDDGMVGKWRPGLHGRGARKWAQLTGGPVSILFFQRLSTTDSNAQIQK
jgi:hypothetical protein